MRWLAAPAVALVLSGCGTPALTGTNGHAIAALPASTLPPRIGDLTVQPEQVGKAVAVARHSYVDAVGFYSLRSADKVVQGTLEIARFGPSARLSSAAFRTQVANEASAGTPEPVTVHGTTVEQSSGPKATVTVWYSQRRLVVLTVLSSYTRGRGLLEDVLDLVPGS